MNVNYDDLVAYLANSEDWHQIESSLEWLEFAGPPDAEGTPRHLLLPSSALASDLQYYITTAVCVLAAVEEIPKDTMADRITPSSVKALLQAIVHFDCEPGVFTASVQASDHQTGYTAYVDFRTSIQDAAREISTHGSSPEEALQCLLNVLKTYWGRCPHCSHYLHGDGQDTPG